MLGQLPKPKEDHIQPVALAIVLAQMISFVHHFQVVRII